MLILAAKSILATPLHAFLSSNQFAEQCVRSRATICCDGGLRRAVDVPTIILPFAAPPQRASSPGTPDAQRNDKQEHITAQTNAGVLRVRSARDAELRSATAEKTTMPGAEARFHLAAIQWAKAHCSLRRRGNGKNRSRFPSGMTNKKRRSG